MGVTLTARTGTWSPAATSFSYQWFANGVAIPGATTATYTLGIPDIGKQLTVAVTGSRAGYASVTRTSAKTAAVSAAGYSSAPNPVISGTRAVGSVLTAVTGTWTPVPDGFRYQWYRVTFTSSGSTTTAILGETQPTYNLTVADRGKGIKVKVTGLKPGCLATSRTSSTTARIQGSQVPGVVTVSGIPSVGRTSTGAAGTAPTR